MFSGMQKLFNSNNADAGVNTCSQRHQLKTTYQNVVNNAEQALISIKNHLHVLFNKMAKSVLSKGFNFYHDYDKNLEYMKKRQYQLDNILIKREVS